MPVETVLELVRRVFGGFLDAPHPWVPRPRLDQLPFGLHLVVGTATVELFPPGPLDVLRFFQRHHDSRHHDLEYVLCRPEGAPPDALQAYGVVRLRPEAGVPLPAPSVAERALRLHYGTLVELPRASAHVERRHGRDFDDEDPPEGPHRIVAPPGEPRRPGRMSVAEVLDIVRRDLDGPETIGWIEGCFRQPPPAGRVEHRYYLDAEACLWLVRHDARGKVLYRAEVSEAALRPRGASS